MFYSAGLLQQAHVKQATRPARDDLIRPLDWLTADEVALLRAWIDQGAAWPTGVSLTAPKIEQQR